MAHLPRISGAPYQRVQVSGVMCPPPLEDQVADNRRAAAAAVIIATGNDRNNEVAQLVAAAGDGSSSSDVVQILEYLESAPRRVGNVLEDAAGDVLEAGEDVINEIIDLFDW